MSYYLIQEETLQDIADAVRHVSDTDEAIPVSELAQNILDFEAKLISSAY